MNELQTISQTEIINIEDFAMSIDGLIKQTKLILEAMKTVMVPDVHYGIIPGTKKPTLYKAGAEKLCLLFRFEPVYEIIREIREKDFISYTIKCILVHSPTGKEIATGIGSCNSRESKYLWRYEVEPTDIEIPKEYWKARSQNNNKEMRRILGDGNRPYKTEDDKWVIAKSKKILNDNPWDVDNTLIKMACKRSHIAATLNGTAASDVFDQDLEDLFGKMEEPPQNETLIKTAIDPDEFDYYISKNYKDINKKILEKFLEECAKLDNKHVDWIKSRAMKNITAFINAFQKYEAKQPKEEKPKKRGPKSKKKQPEGAPQDLLPSTSETNPIDTIGIKNRIYTYLHYVIDNYPKIFIAKAKELGFGDFTIDELPEESAKMLYDVLNKENDVSY